MIIRMDDYEILLGIYLWLDSVMPIQHLGIFFILLGEKLVIFPIIGAMINGFRLENICVEVG